MADVMINKIGLSFRYFYKTINKDNYSSIKVAEKNGFKKVSDANKVGLLNKIIPDMITAIKQDWGYQKLINEPLHPIDRPISDSARGRKLLPSITSIWDIKK